MANSSSASPACLILTTGQGHLSLAQAAQAWLAETPMRTEIHRDADWSLKPYVLFYRYFPKLWKRVFLLQADNQSLSLLVRLHYYLFLRQKVAKLLKTNSPAKAVTTYFLFNPAIQSDTTPVEQLVTIISDPRSIHPLLIADPPAINCVFDETALEQCRQHKPDAQYLVTGWLTHPKFFAKYDQADVRKKLSLSAKLPIILFTLGSDGTEHINRLITNVIELGLPVEIIIVCGHNKLLHRRFEELARNLPAESLTKLHVVGFVNTVEQYMQAADLIVGKAGPNTLFESVATQTPFLAVTHIHGQEDGNLDIIREYNLGYVQEDQQKALQLIQEIIEQPDQLKAFEKPIQKLAAYNEHAGEKLKKVLLEK